MVNGESHEVVDSARVADVVAELAGGRTRGIAVAVNGEIVPRSEWAASVVAEGDRVEVLSAIGGG